MKRRYILILTFLWVVLITTLSLVSFNSNSFSTFQNSDKIVHFVFYFVLTLLLLVSFNTKLYYKYLIIILVISYGIIIEVLQNEFTLTRKADFNDVIANTTGVFCAVLLHKYLLKNIFSKIIKIK